MKVEIVTPVGVKFAGECSGVIAPGVLGDLGILPAHEPILAALRTGICIVSVPGNEPQQLVMDGGYLHVTEAGGVTITTELCEAWQEVDAGKAKEALVEAQAALLASKEPTSSKTWQVKKHDVDLAETRIRVAAARP
jgi:F-type H+-transporting ATPase subunit epsilon